MAVVPSPKFHFQAVGDPVEVSENRTVSGALPDVGVAANSANGVACVPDPVCVEDPPIPHAVTNMAQTAAAAATNILRFTVHLLDFQAAQATWNRQACIASPPPQDILPRNRSGKLLNWFVTYHTTFRTVSQVVWYLW